MSGIEMSDRPPCPPDEHCPRCTLDEEDECHRCGMSLEDRRAQFNAWLDEMDDDEATVVDEDNVFLGWTRRVWPCDDCSQVVSAYTKGDGAEGVRLVHDDAGHRLVCPPSPGPYWLDKPPPGVGIDLRPVGSRRLTG